MLDQQTVERLAQRLDDAERSKSLITAFTREYPDLTIEDAYAIQRAWTKLQLSRGRIVRGHKIGLTSKAMQNAVGISEPDYGVLFADMFYPDASPIPFDRFHAPRIEVELAFVLKAPLKGPGCTLFDVLNATDYVTPALEILETRMHRIDPVTKAPRKVMDTISDNAANAALVVGRRPIRPLDFDVRWIGALLFRNGQIEETGIAAAVLNHPANGVAWLADRLAAQGEYLEAGEVVLAGSFTPGRHPQGRHVSRRLRPVRIGVLPVRLNNKASQESSDDKAQEHSYRRVQAPQSDSDLLPHRQSPDVGRHPRPRRRWQDAGKDRRPVRQHVRTHEGDRGSRWRNHRRHHQDDGVAAGSHSARTGEHRMAEDVSRRAFAPRPPRAADGHGKRRARAMRLHRRDRLT